LLTGTNYFTDSMGNIFNLEFEESLIRNRLIHISSDFAEFYDMDDIHYICTLFCGDRYFLLRIFNIGWDEINYSGITYVVVSEEDLVWSKFFLFS